MVAVKVREVAKKLSVSPATVSRVLQGTYGTGRLSISTATKVLEYCHTKGYVTKEGKNHILMKMKIQASDQKIFCLSCLSDLWAYNTIFSSVSGYLQDKGQFTSFFTVRSSNDLAHFPTEQAGALIVLGRISSDTHKSLIKWKMPVVIADYYLPNSKWCTVNTNNLEAVSQAVNLLVEKGHRRIAFLCRHEDFPERTYNLHQRQSGYIIGMTNAGLDYEELIITSDSSEKDVQKTSVNEIVEELRFLSEKVFTVTPLPTAVIAANDLTAHVFRTVVREKGLRIPEDISIIGHDGQHRLPGIVGFEPVSTIVVNYKAMAKAMADLASDLMVDPLQDVRHIIIPAEYENMGTVAEPHTL